MSMNLSIRSCIRNKERKVNALTNRASGAIERLHTQSSRSSNGHGNSVGVIVREIDHVLRSVRSALK